MRRPPLISLTLAHVCVLGYTTRSWRMSHTYLLLSKRYMRARFSLHALERSCGDASRTSLWRLSEVRHRTSTFLTGTNIMHLTCPKHC